MLSDYLKEKFIDHTLRDTSYTSPGTNIWLSLHTGDPGGNGANEAAGGSYTRIQFTNWSAPAERRTSNSSDIDFGLMSSSLGAVSYLGVWDDATSGNFLLAVPVNPSLIVSTGSTPKFLPGQVVATVEGNASNYLADAWLNHVLRNTAFVSPGEDIYIGLHTLPPGQNGANEVTNNNYARVKMDDWIAPVDGETKNNSNVQFPTPSGNWGLISYLSVWDAPSSGNALALTAVDTPYNALSGDTNVGVPALGLIVLVV